MANSSTVSSGEQATASQYNNLRDDVLSTTSGHLHDASNGRAHAEFTILAAEGDAAIFYMKADEGDDAGDEWKFNVADGGVLTFGNDIASAGSYVSMLTITPHATTASSSVAIAGDATVGDDLSLTSDSSVFNMGAGNDFTITHDGTTGATIAGTPISIDSTGELHLNSTTGDIKLQDGGTDQIAFDLDGTSGVVIIKPMVDSDDLVIQQYDGTEVLRIEDGAYLNVSNTTASSSATTGSAIFGGGIGVAADAYVGDDLYLISDSAVLGFGADKDTTLTHTDGTGLTLNSTNKLTFGDAATFIHQSSDGVMTIDGEATIDLNASTAVLVSNDLKLNSDSAVLGFGADNDTTLTHTDGTGLTLNSTNKLTFGDAASYIAQSSDGTLRIDGEAIIDLNASTRVDVSHALTVGTDVNIGDDLSLTSDSAVFNMGDGNDFTITHDGTTGATIAGNPIIVDSGGQIELDSHTGIFTFEDGGTEVLRFTEGNSGDVTIKLVTNGKDLIFTDNGDATNMKILDAAAGINVPGEVQTTGIGYTDGDNAMTIADGGAVTFPVSIDVTGSAGIILENDETITNSTNGYIALSGSLTIPNAGTIGSAGDADSIAIASDGVVTMNQIPVFSAGINVSGGTIAGTLATAAQTNITSLGTQAADFKIGNGYGFLLGHTTQESIEAVSGLEWQMHGTGNADSRMAIGRWSADNNGPRIHLFKSGKSGAGGTIGTNAIVADGAHLGSIAWGADDGTDLVSSPARIDAYIDGTPGENDTPGRLVFRTAADGSQSTTERMRIASDGFVSIGAIDPDQLLHLSAGNSYLFIESTEASDANGYRGNEISFIGRENAANNRAAMGGIRVEHDGTAADHSGKMEIWLTNGNGNDSLFGSGQGGTAALIINSDHDATLDGSLTQSSDIALKTNINTIDSALDKVNQMRGVSFDRLDKDVSSVGLIAQELEQIAPELVQDNEEYKSVAYTNLTAYLIEAIKELSNKVKELEAK